MKTVMNKEAVAHKWANRLQENAKSNGGGTLYFERDTIYSYGRHFAIAKHLENKEGKRIVLFTNRSYSNSTAKHIRVVWSASSHLDKINVADPSEGFYTNIVAIKNSVKSILKRACELPKTRKIYFRRRKSNFRG